LQNYPKENLSLKLFWKAIKPADLDYSVFIHLWNPRQNKLIGNWSAEPVFNAWEVWQDVPGNHFQVAYHTRLWQAGETIIDGWRFKLPDAPPGVYNLRVGLFDPASGKRLPVEIDGQVMGEWVNLHDYTLLSR